MSTDQLLLVLLFGPLVAFAALVGLWRLRQAPPPVDEEDESGPPAEEGRDPRW
ncbi:MAG: hypothetical protein MUE92_05690 [Chloroflexi bacterium]|jgi:hypothetical protein|nr:hypothetical protein [Chloroflexota bacterium]